MTGLNREIERARAGEPARVFFKLNSLTDREVIDKISEASRAGVHVEMIIRGISCLLPGVPEKTENVQIRSIVGRFLEHARVYAFGEDADTIYLSYHRHDDQKHRAPRRDRLPAAGRGRSRCRPRLHGRPAGR